MWEHCLAQKRSSLFFLLSHSRNCIWSLSFNFQAAFQLYNPVNSSCKLSLLLHICLFYFSLPIPLKKDKKKKEIQHQIVFFLPSYFLFHSSFKLCFTYIFFFFFFFIFVEVQYLSICYQWLQ